MSTSLEKTTATRSGGLSRGPRRSWSPDEKRRIVEEAVRPGASVAEVARRHSLKANLVFTWKRANGAALTAAVEAPPPVVIPRPDTPPFPPNSSEFMPIGTVAGERVGVPVAMGGDLPLAVASGFSDPMGVPRPAMDERPGVIEIDLVDGVRLRVEAFVNERALRRVLAVLKAAS